jgi:phosphohistidine swiveling domain-containing protein
MTFVGKGRAIGVNEPVSGICRFVADINTVMRLAQEDVSEYILIVPTASATGIAPILAEVRGVICSSGGETSHLALVCKEFGVPCVMRTQLNVELTALDGHEGRIEPSGSILLTHPDFL